jgi:hypothetical protein
LRETLQAKPSLEMRQRVESLLKKLEGPITLPKKLQTLRAIWVLERIGSGEARQLLEVLATGSSIARETLDAQAALERLVGRP